MTKAPAILAFPIPSGDRPERRPVLVEPFRSQGYSDCPPVQADPKRLADRLDVLAPSFDVTRRNHPGGKDGFASPASTQRGGDHSVRYGAGVAAPQSRIDGRAAGGADVLLARYDPRTIAVPIRAEESGGGAVPPRDIVRQLARVGRWSGAPLPIAVPAAVPNLRTAVPVRACRGGPILAAARG